MAIKELSDERRAVYDEIKGMSPAPQTIEILRPRVPTEETEDAEGRLFPVTALPGGVEVMLYEPRHATAIDAAK